MKKFVLFLCLFAFAVLPACGAPQIEVDRTVNMTPRLISSNQELSSSQIAETVKSAIVGISAKLKNGTSIGSGVAISDGGYVLTNFHVINGSKKITLYCADKSQTPAQFLWGDSSMDLALLKSEKNLPYLDASPLSTVSIGDDVLAVGTPLSLNFQHTFTKGIVSAKDRTIEISSLGGLSTYMQNLIQHDASINSGNSGGPLINTQGKIIGINSLKASDAEGIGFAIPIETIEEVAKKIIPNGTFNKVYLGIFAENSANSLQQETYRPGAIILDIDAKSLAHKAGFQKGDIITNISGREIKNSLDFRKAIYALDKNQTVVIKFWRGNKQQTISLFI